EHDTDYASQGAQDESLDQELVADIALPPTYCHADADLARTLRDGDEHDVHDANASNCQRDGCDTDQQCRQDRDALLSRLDELVRVEDSKVISGTCLDMMLFLQKRRYFLLRLGDIIHIVNLGLD